ncbi:hypothetical protein DPSP01_008937 [Paraphaeosphaeria sporulosa]
MSRTIELGRAVIAMQAANIELWLTTLITLSPDLNNPAAQNISFDADNLEIDTLLDYMSSGNVWVKRGNDMHMSFNCTKLGQPLDSHGLQQLGDCIVNAPAWKQLGFRISLPVNYEPTHGKLHLNIDRWREDAQSPTNAEGSYESSLSVDLWPPNAIPIFNLNSIEFVMAFCETRTRAPARKRPKREAAKSALVPCDAEAFFADTIRNADPSSRSDPLLNSACQSKAMDQGESIHVQARLCKTPSNPNFDLKLASPNRGKRKVYDISSEPNNVVVDITDDMLSDPACIAALAEAGLRFSICLHLKGSLTNLKVKANTFIHGLTNVAPALWRVNYTSACAHVTYTAPTLARSLDRLGSSAISESLKGKIAELKKMPTGVNPSLGRDAASTIADRLWCHVLKTQSVKTAFSSIKTLCDPGFQANSAETGEEILEEYRDISTIIQYGTGEQLHNIEPSTTNIQIGSTVCLTSNSINKDSTTSTSQILNEKVPGEGEIETGRDGSVKQNLLNNIRASRDNTLEVQRSNTLISPCTDVEQILFNF